MRVRALRLRLRASLANMRQTQGTVAGAQCLSQCFVRACMRVCGNWSRVVDNAYGQTCGAVPGPDAQL